MTPTRPTRLACLRSYLLSRLAHPLLHLHFLPSSRVRPPTRRRPSPCVDQFQTIFELLHRMLYHHNIPMDATPHAARSLCGRFGEPHVNSSGDFWKTSQQPRQRRTRDLEARAESQNVPERPCFYETRSAPESGLLSQCLPVVPRGCASSISGSCAAPRAGHGWVARE
jgi:hypothetical protein